jgi:hypothetical protein
MTRLSHTASFHATSHKYCSAHSDNTKHKTCRDLLLRVSVGDRLMARVEFTLHNQSWNLVDGLCIPSVQWIPAFWEASLLLMATTIFCVLSWICGIEKLIPTSIYCRDLEDVELCLLYTVRLHRFVNPQITLRLISKYCPGDAWRSVSRQVYSLFQSEFSIECDLVASSFNFPYPLFSLNISRGNMLHLLLFCKRAIQEKRLCGSFFSHLLSTSHYKSHSLLCGRV